MPAAPHAPGGMSPRGPHHSDWFESPRPTARRLAVRPFPRVSGKLGQLWHCLEHLGEIADRRSVEVEYVNTPYGEIAWYDLNANRIMIHRDFDANPALKAFAVAHELGHALDPNFVKLPEDYLKRFRRGSFEVVAEASAIRCLKSFGLKLTGENEFLDNQNRCGLRRESWRRALDVGLFDRYISASIPLLKPTINEQLYADRNEVLMKSMRRAYKYAIREQLGFPPDLGVLV